jgi:Protein kinase domain
VTWGGGGVSEGVRVVALPARWRCVRLLGVGGQAEVWLAEDRELAERVAVKVFSPDLSRTARERLRREVRLGHGLLHANLVRVFELVERQGRLAVVMEWMAGGSLADEAEAGQFTIARVASAAEDVLEALSYLHAHGVVHRDVKPSNLLVDADGRVRLGDLGLARLMECDERLTRTAMTVGTPAYMSPEQIRGEEASPASDLYSLGATLFQLLTGHPPFEAASEFEIANLHLKAPPPDPRLLRPDCPTWLARFVMRLMEKRPGDRLTAGGAAAALGRHRTPLGPRVRRRALLVAGVMAVAALGVWGGEELHDAVARGAAVRFETAGSELEGVDARGRETWRYELSAPIQQLERADLDGDGSKEAVAVASIESDHRTVERARSEVLIANLAGRVMTRVSPETLLTDWPYEYPLELRPRVRLADLDGDGRPEVVLSCRHANFYPFVMLVYWPRLEIWEPILYHSGTLHGVQLVTGTSPGHLRFCGVNNRLGMVPVVGEIVVPRPGSAVPPGETLELDAPDFTHVVVPAARWCWYTLLAQGREPTALTIGKGGETVVVLPGERRVVDGWGNPVPGPNAGRDLRALRAWFLGRIDSLTALDQPVDPAGIRARLAEVRERAHDLLVEPAYRAVLETAVARALARVGDLAGAVRLLDQTVAAEPYDDVVFRLAQFEALSGRLDAALARAQLSMSQPHTQRANYDTVQLAVRLAIEMRRVADLRSDLQRLGVTRLERQQESMGVSVALAARAHVWWDEVREADCAAQSWSVAPAGAAMACLARWRLGRSVPADIDAMRRLIVRDPDAAWEGRLALAAAQLGTGREQDAVVTLGNTIAGLEPLSRDDFMNRQVLDLARGLYVKALSAAGERGQAIAEARRVRPLLRDSLLPAILVDEVVARYAQAGPAGSR